ncbi:MAG: hypothetical protein E7035_01045 [Verrucomicrobiaceae bacterium]|nr:hypothetical protein [Verrucomicrobiaceae bacterium]
MKKTLAIISSFVIAFTTFAVERVVVRTVYNSGKIESKTVSLEKQKDGAYRLSIPVVELSKDINFIDVHTDDAQAKKGDDGYWVLSDGRSGRFYRTYGHLVERRNPMPLYGVKKGDSAFVGIVKGLKYEFEMHIDVEEGNYTIYPRFLIKGIEFAPYEDLIVDFYNFKGKDANYSSMGKAYRKYQLDRGEVQPISERVKKYPTLAYTADTMFVRIKHGSKAMSKIEHQTEENEPPLYANYTFDDFMKITRDLKSAGIDKLEMCFVGWNRGGFDGRFPDLFPVEPKFGGEAKMREAIKLGQSFGYQMVCHVCNTDFYRIAKRFDEYAISKRLDGSLRPYAHMAGGRAYNPCFQVVCDRYIDDDYKGMSDLGLKGTHHIDVTSCIVPYTCHDKAHPCNRQQTADYQNLIGEKCRKYFGGFGSEGPCDHVAKTLDYALYVWAYPNWVGGENPLVDRLVPIWQIAYHGIILSNPYYSTIDYTYDNPNRIWSPYKTLQDKTYRRLKMAELNGRPTFYFIDYKAFGVKPIKEAYDEYQPMKHLQYEFIDFHDEIAPDVFITKFSNGEYIITNYTDFDFTYDGNVISAKSYKLLK